MTEGTIKENIRQAIKDDSLYIGKTFKSYNELCKAIGIHKRDFNNGRQQTYVKSIIEKYISIKNTPFYNSRFGITIDGFKNDVDSIDNWKIDVNELDDDLFFDNDKEFWDKINSISDADIEEAELEEIKSRYSAYTHGNTKLPDFVSTPVSSTLSFVPDEYRQIVNSMNIPLGVLCDIADMVEYPKDNCKYSLMNSNEGIMKLIAERNDIGLNKTYEYLNDCINIGWLFKTRYRGVYLVNPWFVRRGRVRLKARNPYTDFFYDKDLHKWVFLGDIDEVVR